MKTILFICTGNVCRSPMAEGIFRQAIQGRGNYRVVSAGLGAMEGQEHYRALFARNGWSLGDLDRWDKFERDNPRLFAGMYVFWVQPS